MRSVLAVAAAIAVVLTVVLSAGCGGSPPNTPAAGGTFADATCADLANWAAAVQRALQDLQSVVQFDPSGNSTTAGTQLRQLSTALSDADRATQRLADGISSRRAPDVTNGEQVKKTVLDALKELRDAGKQARASIDAYDVDAATSEQTAKLKSDLQGLGDSVQNTFAQLVPLVAENQQLRAALQNSATCRTAASNLTSS